MLSTSHGWGGASLHVRTCTQSPYLRNRLTNCAKIWCVARDPIVTRCKRSEVGWLHIRTCVSSFVVLETAEPWHWSHTKKQAYLFRARSFIAKHGVLLVDTPWTTVIQGLPSMALKTSISLFQPPKIQRESKNFHIQLSHTKCSARRAVRILLLSALVYRKKAAPVFQFIRLWNTVFQFLPVLPHIPILSRLPLLLTVYKYGRLKNHWRDKRNIILFKKCFWICYESNVFNVISTKCFYSKIRNIGS